MYFLNAYFGQGTGQIVLDNVFCFGTEPRIYDCANSNGIIHASCGHDDDASVRCQPANTSMLQFYTRKLVKLGMDIKFKGSSQCTFFACWCTGHIEMVYRILPCINFLCVSSIP